MATEMTMTGKRRMALAMSGGKVDRTPVMCQMAMGHVAKHAGVDPVEYWFTSAGHAEGYIRMAERYGFDGILLNRHGLDPAMRERIKQVMPQADGSTRLVWDDGAEMLLPVDDDPRYVDNRKRGCEARDVGAIKSMTSAADLPGYFFDVIDYVMARKGTSYSIHGEVGTALEEFMLVIGTYEAGLIALMDDPAKCHQIMEKINANVIIRAVAQAARGVAAMKLSSPFAGAGFISREMYLEFVLPYEKAVIAAVHQSHGLPCYIHTCGAIGDRLDLMQETGTDGLECLDPPPLGTVKLEQAVQQVGGSLFFKGNLDSVHERTRPAAEVREIARERIKIGRRAKGYILSSACSISPMVPPENIELLRAVAEEMREG